MQSCWVGWEEGGLHLGSQIERLNPWKPSAGFAGGGEHASHGVDLLLAAGGLRVLSAPAIRSLGLAGGWHGADTRYPSFKNKIKIKKQMPLEGADIPAQWTVSTCIPGGDTAVLSLQLSQTSCSSRSTLKLLDPHVLAGKSHIPSLTFPSEHLDWACWKAWKALPRPQGRWDPLRDRFPNVKEPLEGVRTLPRGLSLPRILAALATRRVWLQKQPYSHQKWDVFAAADSREGEMLWGERGDVVEPGRCG